MRTLKGKRLEILKKNGSDLQMTILENRKINPDKLDFFVNPKYEDLFDPFLLPGMNEAVERIIKAKENQERVVIFGDYDVDGVSSTAMLVRFFHENGIKVSYRIPHRVNDGYGLKSHFIDELKTLDVKLIVTVDCGSRDIDVINYINSLGIDVIVTDHHTVPEIIPSGLVALINPKLDSSKYPNRELSGSGVAFKLLHALATRFYPENELRKVLTKYIDFAMLGTIADCMNLIGENRTIAYLGLKQLKNTHSPGLRKLLEGNDLSIIDSDLISFKVGPKLNAAGRMDTPYKALKVLLAGEQALDEALREIETLNTKRKVSVETFLRKAYEKLDESKNLLVFDSTEIEHGIIGLIAGRLCEAFNKVSIALKDEGEKLVGSMRAPSFINIMPLLEGCKDYFEVFGGHDQAAGFTILKKNYKDFIKHAESHITHAVSKIDTSRTITVDAHVRLEDLDFKLYDFIQKLQPYGIGNPKPVFMISKLRFDLINFIGKDEKHLKFGIRGSQFGFTAFGFGEHFKTLKNNQEFGIVFELEKNVWNGKKTLNLNIKDIIV